MLRNTVFVGSEVFWSDNKPYNAENFKKEIEDYLKIKRDEYNKKPDFLKWKTRFKEKEEYTNELFEKIDAYELAKAPSQHCSVTEIKQAKETLLEKIWEGQNSFIGFSLSISPFAKILRIWHHRLDNSAQVEELKPTASMNPVVK